MYRRKQNFVIGNRIIGKNHPVFFIAEIGENHQGDIVIAKRLIDAAVISGADCVIFQKTDIEEKFTKEVLEREYINENSFGRTYGDHKRHLELSKNHYFDLQTYAKTRNIMFSATPMDLNSLKFLLEIDVPFIKIGPGDNTNIPLITAAAKSGKPLIISTGMASGSQIHSTVNEMRAILSDKPFALSHCVSSYPTPVEHLNLSNLKDLQGRYPDLVIGYSGHEIEIEFSVRAAALGARIIERHLTLDQNQPGSYHKCSLLPHQFDEMVKKVKEIDKAMGVPRISIYESEKACWEKLGKSFVAARLLKAGKKIENDDLKMKVSSKKGIDGIHYFKLLGLKMKRDVNEDEPLTLENVCLSIEQRSEFA